MSFSTSLLVWVLLVLATIAELVLFRIPPADRMMFTSLLFGLAGLKALLIAVFYQNTVAEGRGITIFYFTTLLLTLGIVIGTLTSMSQIHMHV